MICTAWSAGNSYGVCVFRFALLILAVLTARGGGTRRQLSTRDDKQTFCVGKFFRGSFFRFSPLILAVLTARRAYLKSVVLEQHVKINKMLFVHLAVHVFYFIGCSDENDVVEIIEVWSSSSPPPPPLGTLEIVYGARTLLSTTPPHITCIVEAYSNIDRQMRAVRRLPILLSELFLKIPCTNYQNISFDDVF